MSKKTHEQKVRELAAQLDPRIGRPTPLNPNGLPIDQRMPDIASRLLILECLFEAAASDWASGATPSHHNADETEWSDWFEGLRRIIRDVRVIAEDCFEEGFAPGGGK